MKRILKRISAMVAFLIGMFQNFCFADVIVSDPTDYITPVWFGVIIIGVIVIIISLISFFSLKSMVKREEKNDYNSESDLKDTIKNKEKQIRKKEKKIYIWAIIICIMLAMYMAKSWISLLIPIFLVIISIISRNMEKKKLSYIIYFVAIVSIGIMPLMNFISEKRIENYNNQFLQYQEIEYGEHMYRNYYTYKYSYITNINDLITTTINNNKNNKKQVSLIYLNKTYTTEAELKQLQTMLNISNRYYITIKKDKNYEYIESITLSTSPTNNSYLY